MPAFHKITVFFNSSSLVRSEFSKVQDVEYAAALRAANNNRCKTLHLFLCESATNKCELEGNELAGKEGCRSINVKKENSMLRG